MKSEHPQHKPSYLIPKLSHGRQSPIWISPGTATAAALTAGTLSFLVVWDLIHSTLLSASLIKHQKTALELGVLTSSARLRRGETPFLPSLTTKKSSCSAASAIRQNLSCQTESFSTLIRGMCVTEWAPVSLASRAMATSTAWQSMEASSPLVAMMSCFISSSTTSRLSKWSTWRTSVAFTESWATPVNPNLRAVELLISSIEPEDSLAHWKDYSETRVFF